jgi:hypothetical protein
MGSSKGTDLERELTELSTPENTCLAKSFVPAITFIHAFLPSSNLEYEASVRNTEHQQQQGREAARQGRNGIERDGEKEKKRREKERKKDKMRFVERKKKKKIRR